LKLLIDLNVESGSLVSQLELDLFDLDLLLLSRLCIYRPNCAPLIHKVTDSLLFHEVIGYLVLTFLRLRIFENGLFPLPL
jgi:hypothetical protein